MSRAADEVNFDGIVGPTHSYAGLSYGNLASQRNKGDVSNPRQAALEGLAKMELLADLGVSQAVLPPQERPDVEALRRLGFSGSDARVLEAARREDPVLLAACCSASGMWAANAATVSPSADAADGRVHFTPANLVTQFHRSLEPATTGAALRAIFADEARFAHHLPLPAAAPFSDEGAANHTRLCAAYGRRGIELFVYGRSAFASGSGAGPKVYPARQTLEASAAVARLHRLGPSDRLLVQQNPAAIDGGAFHNDVAAVGNLNVMLYHAAAFVDASGVAKALRDWFEKDGEELFLIEVTEEEVPLAAAVRSYLFNSQLVLLPDGTMSLVAPAECREEPAARDFLARLPGAGTPIRSVRFVDVRQSMRNGGGPACLRLRVVLTAEELAATNPGVFLTGVLHEQLTDWVTRHYRERLHADDLADPRMLDESRAALDALTRLLGLGPIYRFQR